MECRLCEGSALRRRAYTAISMNADVVRLGRPWGCAAHRQTASKPSSHSAVAAAGVLLQTDTPPCLQGCLADGRPGAVALDIIVLLMWGCVCAEQ